MALIPAQQFGNNNLTDAQKQALEGEYGLNTAGFEPLRTYTERGRTLTRGILAPKDFTDERDVVTFQYNPTILQDEKLVQYTVRGNVGFSANDYAWAKGGERTIDFELFLDATAGSNNTVGGQNVAYGNDSIDTLDINFPNGTLDMVENITKFLYPIQEVNQPRFTSGLAVPSTRFLPPPIAVFVFGPIYLTCVVLNAPVTHELFDKDLKPRRSRVKVRVGIIETEVVIIDERLRGK